MKRLFIVLMICQLILITTGCNINQVQNNAESQNEKQISADSLPEKAVNGLLKALQHQDFSGAKKYYVKNFDNMANLHNQLEDISPAAANQFFSKLADFTYSIESTFIDSNSPSQATAYVTIDYYDVGKTFETTLLEYIKNDISMTYDGKKDDDIRKQADEVITEVLDKSSKETLSHIPVSLVLKDSSWKVTKLSENPELLNALTGNILTAIEKLTVTINANK